ncbi:hypothetical protein BDN72DRAFT_965567 [Pluteus cervinus]|uniref:Uncharacterized protein n=1 Tax=Pluteus cervinus TaxID=181527 RepID=A0ACD3A4D6_9AGAR|nr:hypothetical protein BDN72DRAFT_965567 [Pluteus cervinus]
MSTPMEVDSSTDVDLYDSPEVPPIPTVHALIIGIDTYPKFHNLTGAARDARRFKKFVRNYLFAEESNIITLLNQAASREAILNGFEKLISNDKINQDDPIIIYFAGHGSRIEKPKEWEDDWPTVTPMIEMMCPSDLDPAAGSWESEEGRGIPDRTIAALLHRLSQKKGDNITLILDCCCSAGLDRGDTQYLTRGIAKPPRITAFCDDDIVKLAGPKADRGVQEGFWGKHHASHVLLAACGVNQEAKEVISTRCGVFTNELIKVLTREDVELNQLTYTSLMNQLRMPNFQTPHCEGQNIGRRLFNKWRSGANPAYIAGTTRTNPEGPGGVEATYVLHAGEVHGVVPGSTYAIHGINIDEEETPDFNPPLCNAIVGSVTSFTAQLRCVPLEVDTDSPPNIPEVFYAKRLTEGEEARQFIVYCNDARWFSSVISADVHRALGFTFISPLSNPQSLNPELADLRVTYTPQRVSFERKTGTLVSDFVGTRYRDFFPPHQAKYKLKDVIRAALRFKLHLSKQQSSSGDKAVQGVLKTKVWFELKELDSSNYEGRKPIGRNILLHADPNQSSKAPKSKQDIVSDRVVASQDPDEGMDDSTVTLEVKRWYTLIIHNDSDTPLYPYVAFFDPGMLQIDFWYTPAIGGEAPGSNGGPAQVDFPLPAKSTLGIGYGESSTSPWTFEFAEGDNCDIGYFKIYLTTKNSDFSSVAQDTPFTAPDFNSLSNDTNTNIQDDRGDEEKVVGDAWIARTLVVKQVPEGQGHGS